jgi:serine/threonine protein kinase
LVHIHSKNIIHKDIRPENIIQANNQLFNLIIANFGSAEVREKCKKRRIVNPGFMAPELF